ncbi:hypothetical protein [Flavobacterium sp.]|uniref:hypothetical protein n=1 Tax=Flavobacterium sp. TaxID=239 RepID=UPI002FD88B8C
MRTFPYIPRVFWLLLAFYHLLLSAVAYVYLETHDGDAYLYWFAQGKPVGSWFSYLGFGTDSILFLNYPFAQVLELPFWMGSLFYSALGFLGIVTFSRLFLALLGDTLAHRWVRYLVYFVLLLPNLHFWTGLIGKEALVFWGLSTLFWQMYQQRYRSFAFVFSLLLLGVIRPHLVLLLALAFGVAVLLSHSFTFRVKLQLAFVVLGVAVLAFYPVLQLTQLYYWDWERVVHFNAFSRHSFQHAQSYIPLDSYALPEQYFAFLFRPFFESSASVYSWVLSIENAWVLLLHLIGLPLLFYYYPKGRLAFWFGFVLLFTVLAVGVYLQRYSALGIFVRTKIQFQPFVLLLLTWGLSRLVLSPKSSAV